LLTLARELKITIPEAEAMTLDEFNEWVAYFKVISERNNSRGQQGKV